MARFEGMYHVIVQAGCGFDAKLPPRIGDLAERELWGQYMQAFETALEKTSTEAAPWYIIPANDKKYARIEVLKTHCRRLDKALRDKEE